MWNICGLRNKTNDIEFLNCINDVDICILVETWLHEDIEITGFSSHHLHAEKKSNRHGRYSGGVTVLIRKDIRKHFSRVHEKCKYGVWLKTNKAAFASDVPAYIGGIYLPPRDSDYARNQIFDTIESDISELLTTGKILILGDFNARSSNLNDYIAKSSSDENCGLDEDCIDPGQRFNSDQIVNNYGRKLTTLCKNSDLVIMNGRCTGDIPGHFTCHTTNGSSVVDYGLLSTDLLHNVCYFHVLPPNMFSDHCCIKTCIKLKNLKTAKEKNETLKPLDPFYQWSENSKTAYLDTMKSDAIKTCMSKIMSTAYNQTSNGTEQLCSAINQLYTGTADLSLKRRKNRTTLSRKAKEKYNYKDKEYYNKLKQDIIKTGQLLHMYPNDPYLRGKYITMKKNFKKMIKNQQKLEKDKLLDKIATLKERNPKDFWQMVNKFKQKKQESNIDPSEFFEYFKKLHRGVSNDNRFDDNFKTHLEQKLTKLKRAEWNEILDSSIDGEEIVEATKSLKNKKACGFDSISNEMIKHSAKHMMPLLTKLFNHVHTSEHYPQQWTEGYIKPLFKKGNKLDPSNYRGLTISSCLGKLYEKILNNRLIRFLDIGKIIKKNQSGFTKNKRTSDHIFVLKSLMDQAKHKGKPLYFCFVDLKSAFDTVWHPGLFYKLIKSNASNKFINILTSMYSTITARIKCDQGYTETFPILLGTRQGSNLSPTLFNLYINDLVDYLDNIPANQPFIGDCKLSCLLYADDLILISHTASGLQKLINTAESYFHKWRLLVNTDKTKIMVFNRKSDDNMWFIYGKSIEKVPSYCYLGIEIDNRGNFQPGIKRLYSKACRAYMSIREKFNFYNGTAVKVMIKLFESMVQPILLYGSEIWALYSWRKQTSQCITQSILSPDKILPEKLHNMFCKQTLGFKKYSSSYLSKAELGRYPLMGNIVQNIYNFWQHILESNPTDLTYQALKANIELDRKGAISQYTRMKNLLSILNERSAIYKSPTKSMATRIRKNLRNKFNVIYETKFFTQMDSRSNNGQPNGKYEVYSRIKRIYKYEKYLDVIKDNKLRRYITGIRCAENKFPVNCLRKKGIPRDQRSCNMCDTNAIGTEMHILMHCPNMTISSLRNIFVNIIYEAIPQLRLFNKSNMLHYLLQAAEPNVLFYLAIYIEKVSKQVLNHT